MQKQYTRRDYWELFKKLPEELRDASADVDATDRIEEICNRYNVPQELLSAVTLQVGHVLLGIVPPADFQKILEKEVGLKKDTARQVAHEINRFVFYPVKPALEQLHKMEIEVSAKIVTPQPPTEEVEETPRQTPKQDDQYRESVE